MRFAYGCLYMDGAAADNSAAKSRDRGAGVVRPFHARSGATAPFDPLSLFSAEPERAAGKPTARALPPSPKRSARRPPSPLMWLICGVGIGAGAVIAAPRIRLPRPAPPTPIVVVASKPATIPQTIDATSHEQTPAAPAKPIVAHTDAPPAKSSSAPRAPAFGWVSIESPFDVEVFDGQTPVGGSGAKVMLAAGRHTVRLVNTSLGYDERRAVSIAPGRNSRITVDAPKATLDINALPWADISIDGVEVGQTPLAHIPVSIGSHVVQFRHPQLGEQRRTITVTSKGPNRVSADLTTR